MKNKNILIITPIFPPDIGGPASYVPTLIKKLPADIKTKIITFSSEKSPSRSNTTPSKMSSSSRPTHKMSSSSRPTADIGDLKTNIIKIPITNSSISRQLQLFKSILHQIEWADICYVQGTITVGFATMIACKLKNKPYILKYVGDEVWEEYQTHGGVLSLEEFLENVKSIKFILSKIILKNAKTVITPGKYLQKIINKYYKVKSVDIPNAIESPVILKRREAVYPSGSHTKKTPNSIVCIGRLVSWKNVDQVIDALYFLNKQTCHPEHSEGYSNHHHRHVKDQVDTACYHLTIIGSGPEKKNLIAQVKKLNLEKHITFTGKLSKKDTHMQLLSSEFCILYSSYEGLSHTLLEAMQSKTKIIASNIEANSDVLENGKLGKLVELNSSKELVTAVKEKYSKSKLEEAYKTVNSKYNWDNHVKRLVKVLDE